MNLLEKFKNRNFIVSVEIVPPGSADVSKVIKKASYYKGFVDSIDITDCPMANVRLSSFCLGKIIQDETGVESIFNFTCRDRNIIGTESDLIGAFALGVKNILCLWGDPPHLGNRPQAKAVYEVDTLELISLAKKIGFTVGVATNVSLDGKNLENLEKKVSAGADFAITQPVYTLAKVKEAKEIEEKFDIPILLGILPVTDAKKAKNISEKVPGIDIPEEFISDLEKNGRKVGIEKSKEIFLAAKENLAGVQFMMREPEILGEIIGD